MPSDVALIDAPAFYRPGETVRGRAAWRLNKLPKRLESRLVWTTAGKGTTDIVAVASVRSDALAEAGEWAFELTIPPNAPPDYDGRLVSIKWSLVFDTGRSGETAAVQLVVSRTGRPIVPPRLAK